MKLSTYLRGARRARVRVASCCDSHRALLRLGLLVCARRRRRRQRRRPCRSAPPTASLSSPAPGITNTGPTTLNGDLGTFPTTTITGSAVADRHRDEPRRRRRHAAGEDRPRHGVQQRRGSRARPRRSSPTSADRRLPPGVYNSASSIGLTGALTLNGGGNPNAVFVFQAGSTLTTASAAGQPDQRRPGLQRLLAGRQLRDARHRLHLPRNDHRPDQHHASPPARRSTDGCSPGTAPSRSTRTRSRRPSCATTAATHRRPRRRRRRATGGARRPPTAATTTAATTAAATADEGPPPPKKAQPRRQRSASQSEVEQRRRGHASPPTSGSPAAG